MRIKTIPAFIDGAAGKIFTLQLHPETSPKAHIIYLPPFCEEMNRCRQLVSRHARLWAEMGYSCLIVDFFGTGDSEARLEDANWDIWLGDVGKSVEHLLEQSKRPVILCGLRLGALLAADYANKSLGQVDGLVLFQPVATGKSYLTQILRQRVAYLLNNQLPAETTEDMRKRLANGQTIEVAGYTLGGMLTGDMDRRKLSEMSGIQNKQILWLENLSDPEGALPPGSHKVIKQLTGQNNRVTTKTFSAPPIWQLHEREPIDDFLGALSDLEPAV